jgi:hypothetical protein
VHGCRSAQFVAQRLLARRRTRKNPDGFKPSKQLNILAAAWIQTMIHDWLDHELDLEKTVTLDKGFDEGAQPINYHNTEININEQS